jgi:hypothetical protein
MKPPGVNVAINHALVSTVHRRVIKCFKTDRSPRSTDRKREIDISWPLSPKEINLSGRWLNIEAHPASSIKVIRVGISGWVKCADIHVETAAMTKQKVSQDRVFSSLRIKVRTVRIPGVTREAK